VLKTGASACLFLSLFFSATAIAQSNLDIPIWTDLFNADGTVKDVVDASGGTGPNGVGDYAEAPYSGIDAIFVGDWISAGVATDMSALSDGENIGDVIVWNGTVRTEHDVGNAYVFATTDGASTPNLVLYGAAERFGTMAASSYIEFVNQDKVQAISADTPLTGSRADNDVLVRLNLSMGALTSADIMSWSSANGYQLIASVPATAGTACAHDAAVQLYLACDPYLASGEFNSVSGFTPWDDSPRDLNNQPVSVAAPDGVLEFGINVGALLGSNPDFTSIMVRTPEDIVLDSFRNLGLWASAGASSSGN
jgi:hypothetical protein